MAGTVRSRVGWGVGVLLAFFPACDPDELPPRNCANRTAFYADPDGDGWGDPDQVYVGCEAPEGWVSVSGRPPPPHTGAPAPHTATPGVHTGDGHTGVGHTGVGHTGVGHTGVGHTGDRHTGVGHTGVGHTGVGHTGVGHTGVGHTGLHGTASTGDTGP